MCQFDTPLYIYYSYIPVFVLCLLTAILILLRNPKEASNRNAFYCILFLAFYIADVFGQWTIKDAYWNKFLVEISFLSTTISLFFLFFSYHFTETKITLKQKFIFALPCFILFGLAFSKYSFVFFDINNCVYSNSKLAMFCSYFIEIVYAFLATRILAKYYKKTDTYYIAKYQIRVLIGAIWFYVIWDIVSEEIYRISFLLGQYIDNTPHFIFGNLFFVSLIAFSIIKNGLFKFDTLFNAGFTIFLWSLIFLGMILFYANFTVIVLASLFYVALMLIFWKM